MKKFGSDKPRKFAPSGKPKFAGGKPESKQRKTYGGDKSRGFSASGDRPFADRKKPGGFKSKPYSADREDTASDRPKYGADRPKFGSDKPRFGNDRPRYGSDRPRPAGDKPRFGDDRPRYGSDRPRPAGDKPRFGDDRPRYGSDRPRPAGDKPRFGDDRPRYGSDRPKPAGDKPRFGDDRPRSGSDRFKSAGAKPRWEDNRPKFGGNKPRFNSDRPRFGSDRPRFSDEKPKFESDRPAYGARERGERSEYNAQPSKPGGYKPSRFGAKPARPFGAGKPAYGSDKPRFAGKPAKFGAPRKDPYRVWKREDEVAIESSAAELEKLPVENVGDDLIDGGELSQTGRRFGRPNRDWVEPAASAHAQVTAAFPSAPFARKLVVTLEDTRNVPIRLVWIFDTMVAELPDGEPAAGDTVYVHDSKDKFLGAAIYNPNSRIRARIFSLDKIVFNQSYIKEAISKAVAFRKRMGFLQEQSCRVVFGESDGIPGLVADKIAGVLVVQPLTYAVDRQLTYIVDQLNEQLGPDGIVVRTDVPIRAKEGLTVGEVVTHGEVPERVQVNEEGYVLFANPASGQKTGMFLDQRKNRAVLKPFAEGARVLDLFCHVGGWAMRAAKYGAAEVVGVDSSKPALELARAAATENGFEQVSFVEADVFDYFAEHGDDEAQYDIIICDPPAFAKTRAHFEEAIRAYLSLNYRAMKKLKPGGLLVTCSCSQAVSVDEFNDAILTAARNARIQFQIIEKRGAPQDHPVLLGLPETDYLKCFVLRRAD